MTGDSKYYKQRLSRARTQNAVALKSAFNIIDSLAAPSLSPEQFEKYEEVKNNLIKKFSKQ